MKKFYETERLLLKISDSSLMEMVANYYQKNRSFLKEWEPIRGEEFYTKKHHEEQFMKDQLNDHSLQLWIFKKNEENKIIGTIGFTNIVKGIFLSCFLGYGLDEDEINKGFMTEALQKGIEIMFHEYGLHRIEANIMPKNHRSLRVVEKLGFYNEGLAYKYLKINGKWEDHLHMVLLNELI